MSVKVSEQRMFYVDVLTVAERTKAEKSGTGCWGSSYLQHEGSEVFDFYFKS